jgi:hypothetical protein
VNGQGPLAVVARWSGRRAALDAWERLQAELAAASAACVWVPCKGAGDLWLSENLDDQVDAAEGCRGCPVLAACASYAMAAREPAGVWGGLLPPGRGEARRAG